MIPSPYARELKRELNFHRKLLTIDDICCKMMDAAKSVSITLTRDNVSIDTINVSKKDLLAIANYIIEKYNEAQSHRTSRRSGKNKISKGR